MLTFFCFLGPFCYSHGKVKDGLNIGEFWSSMFWRTPVFVYTSSGLYFPIKTPFHKKRSCCLQVGGNSNTAAAKKPKSATAEQISVMCPVQCCTFLSCFKTMPDTQRPVCVILSHYYPVPRPSVCRCFITSAAVNHPAVLIKSVPYEVLLFAAERHCTWPGIKPQKSTLMMKLSWLMFSHTRVRREELGEIDLCQINVL